MSDSQPMSKRKLIDVLKNSSALSAREKLERHVLIKSSWELCNRNQAEKCLSAEGSPARPDTHLATKARVIYEFN